MTLRSLASIVAKREAKKVSIGVAQVREVLRILVDLEQEALNNYATSEIEDYPSNVIGLQAKAKLMKKKRK